MQHSVTSKMRIMKLLFVTSAASAIDKVGKTLNGLQQFYLNNTPGMDCLRCSTHSLGQCQTEGLSERCRIDQVCQVELRRRDGKVEQVSMGCKEREACQNQQAQNFTAAKYRFNQCRPQSSSGPSVCWSCCSGDDCVATLSKLSTVGDWRRNYVWWRILL